MRYAQLRGGFTKEFNQIATVTFAWLPCKCLFQNISRLEIRRRMIAKTCSFAGEAPPAAGCFRAAKF